MGGGVNRNGRGFSSGRSARSPGEVVGLKQGNQSGVLPAQLIELRGPGVSYKASALIVLAVDSIALPPAHDHNKHQYLAVPHFVDQMETSGAELDLGAMAGAPQLAGWNLRFDQPFGQLLSSF